MQAVVISRLLASQNFILYSKSNDLCIFNLRHAHGSLLAVSTIQEGSLMPIFYSYLLWSDKKSNNSKLSDPRLS